MEVGNFSLDQLMELAGLSVSQAGTNGLYGSICSMACSADRPTTSQYTESTPQAQGNTYSWHVGQETMVRLDQ